MITICVCVVKIFSISSLSSGQVLLTLVTMLYFRTPQIINPIIGNLYPLTNISFQPPSPSNQHSIFYDISILRSQDGCWQLAFHFHLCGAECPRECAFSPCHEVRPAFSVFTSCRQKLTLPTLRNVHGELAVNGKGVGEAHGIMGVTLSHWGNFLARHSPWSS